MANEYSAYKSKPNPYLLIRKAVELIDNPLSADYIDRHVQIINDFLDACTCAIWVRDISYVIKLMYLFSEKVKNVPEYRQCFLRLLRICAVPPMLTKSSELLAFREDLEEYFTVFGYLLVVSQDDELTEIILATLKSIFSKREFANCCIDSRICNEALAQSQLPNTISELMCLVDQETYEKLLVTMDHLLTSDDTCKTFIQNDMINIILLKTYPEQNLPYSQEPPYTINIKKQRFMPYFDLSIRILWNLLDVHRKNPEMYRERLVKPETWSSVQHLLRVLTMLKMKKQKRNNLVSLVLLILKLDDVTITCGPANDLALLCAAPEVGTGGTWASEIFFTQEKCDYNFKKLLFLIVSYFPRNADITWFLYERQLVLAIFRLITPEVELPWNEKQRCKLMRYGLLTLCEILDITFDDYIKYDGPVRLLKMVEAFMKSQIRQCTLIACLHCIHKSLRVNKKDIAKIYRKHKALEIMVELLTYMTNLNVLTKQMQHAMICAFCIVQMLNIQYGYDRTDVIDMCLHYVRRCLRPNEEDMLSNSKILIACIDFLWENMIWSVVTLKHFVAVGGTYVLLDILESCCFPIQLVALSVLVDLCEEGSCLPYFLTWRGNGKTAVSMLLDLFRRENQRLGVKSTDNGTIADMEFPLMGRKQFCLTFRNKKDPNSSPAIIDTLGSCRPKIYALLHIINCQKGGITESVNRLYKISSMPLTIQDEITRLLVENYLPLKLGEIWVELKADVETSGIRPLVYDQEIIATMVRRFYKWSKSIKESQQKLAEKYRNQETIEEKVFYNYLREVHLSESLDALDDLRFIARCTENIFRLMAKMKQRDQLRKTWVYDPEFYIKFHMTFMHSIPVTPVFYQKVSIRSNIIVEPKNQNTLEHAPSDILLDLTGPHNDNLDISDADVPSIQRAAFLGNVKSIDDLT